MRGKPFVLCGPSGVGKNMLVNTILKKYPGIFEKKVSHTTRPPRENPKEGSVYYHVSQEEFQKVSSEWLTVKKIDNKDFIEYKEIQGNMYGTCKRELVRINESGKIPIIEVNTAGAFEINK